MEMVVTNEAELDAAVVPVTALEMKNPAMARASAARTMAVSRSHPL